MEGATAVKLHKETMPHDEGLGQIVKKSIDATFQECVVRSVGWNEADLGTKEWIRAMLRQLETRLIADLNRDRTGHPTRYGG